MFWMVAWKDILKHARSLQDWHWKSFMLFLIHCWNQRILTCIILKFTRALVSISLRMFKETLTMSKNKREMSKEPSTCKSYTENISRKGLDNNHFKVEFWFSG